MGAEISSSDNAIILKDHFHIKDDEAAELAQKLQELHDVTTEMLQRALDTKYASPIPSANMYIPGALGEGIIDAVDQQKRLNAAAQEQQLSETDRQLLHAYFKLLESSGVPSTPTEALVAKVIKVNSEEQRRDSESTHAPLTVKEIPEAIKDYATEEAKKAQDAKKVQDADKELLNQKEKREEQEKEARRKEEQEKEARDKEKKEAKKKAGQSPAPPKSY